MSNITIVQIHKPEEKHLIKPYPFNHVVFETVQSDKYDVEVLVNEEHNGQKKVFGKIYYDEFRFDKVRNLAKEFALTEYVFILDADEELLTFDLEKYAKLGLDSYLVTILNLHKGNVYQISNGVRLFKNSIDYIGYAHELPDCDTHHTTDILIKHNGYKDPTKWTEKAKRNNDLIIKSGLALNNEYQRRKLYEGLKLEFEFKGDN